MLEWIGLDAPTAINGIEQSPIEGVSFAGSDAHVTQYFEMLGSRAIYHDGWKAVVFHPGAFLSYDGSDGRRPFDEDVWELYHVAEDFSEVHDLAASEPERLEIMKELWWSEAARYQALPLNNDPVRHRDPRYRRKRYLLHPGIGPMPEILAPNLKGRAFELTAALTVPAEGPVEGTIAAHGGHPGGYVAFLRDRRLHFTYNFLAVEITTVSAEEDLPVGEVAARVIVQPGAGGDAVTLLYGDDLVGEGTIPRRTPVTYGTPGFAVGYQPFGPVDPSLDGRFEIGDGVLDHVVFDIATKGTPLPSTERADLGTQ